MAKFQSLEQLDIDLSREQILDALGPFVKPSLNPDEWRTALWKRRRRTIQKALKRGRLALSGNGKRDLAAITRQYEQAWSSSHERYDLAKGVRKPFPWTYRGKPLMLDMAAAARFRSPILTNIIDHLKPKRVLEVGCGDGINLLLLAGIFPEISFTGLELTEAGVQAAQAVQTNAGLPQHLRNYSVVRQIDLTAFRRINFVRGDASKMPFPDNHFDLVYTILSIEQMERIRHSALREISRVCGGHVLNLEPFAEANRGIWKRLYVWGQNYFRGRIRDLPVYGLQPIWATMDYPQEVMLGTALVLSRKLVR